MDQQKIGAFLKQLRKEKGLTQEELANKLYTTSRTVSRWETGTNLPDLTVLIELSEFYEVDIRELIDGERKQGVLDNSTNDALKKAAEYVEEEKKRLNAKSLKNLLILLATALVSLVIDLLFGTEKSGYLYGIVPENICHIISYVAIPIILIITVIILIMDHRINKKLQILTK